MSDSRLQLFKRWINHYPLDNSIGFASVYLLDSDLSGGQRYPSFEQLGPDDYFFNFDGSIWRRILERFGADLETDNHSSALYLLKSSGKMKTNLTFSTYHPFAHKNLAIFSVSHKGPKYHRTNWESIAKILHDIWSKLYEGIIHIKCQRDELHNQHHLWA